MKTPYSRDTAVAAVIGWALQTAGYEVSIAPDMYAVCEKAGAVTVSVSCAGTGAGACSVRLKTISITAVAGRDYAPRISDVQFSEGETNAEWTVPLIANTVPDTARMFQVVIDSSSNCTPGAATTGAVTILDAQTTATLEEGFESEMPAGWAVVANADSNSVWQLKGLDYEANDTGGWGNHAIANSGEFTDPMDTELLLPAIPVAETALTYLVFRTYYEAGGYDIADVDLSVSGGAGPWTNLWRKSWNGLLETTGDSWWGPITETLDITPLARGQSNVVVRFHYYNATNEWYWEIDDVAILVEADSNTNGLPDWWEIAYWSGLTNLAAGGDSDRDGACDGAEFIAGTDPVDTGACFRVSGVTFSQAVVNVVFETEMAHFYDVVFSTNLLGQAWYTGVSRIQGWGGVTNVSLSNSGGTGYYRINAYRW